MQLPKTLCVHGTRVLTTRQLAMMYETEPEIINNNFIRNKKKYVLEKHYISIEGEEMRQLKTSHQFDGELKRVSRAYFWTEKGALLHAKSLNTDKAWEVYDYLVDFYFRAKEERKVPVTVETKPEPVQKPVSKPAMMTVVDVPENPKILKAIEKLQEDLICMKVLLEDCKKYLSEETYEERRRAASEVVHIIISDLRRLLDLQPKMIQKQY